MYTESVVLRWVSAVDPAARCLKAVLLYNYVDVAGVRTMYINTK